MVDSKHMPPATAMILAAGRGERMRPLTDHLPKPLIEVNGKPLIAYHLEKLALQGVTHVVINVAWLGDLIQQKLGNGEQFGLTIYYSDEGEQALETAGGVIKALPLLADDFWLINADVYTDYTFIKPELAEALAHLVLVNNPDFHPKGDFGLAGGSLLDHADEQFTFAGIGYYNKRFFSGNAQGKRPLAPLIRQFAQQQKVTAVLHHGLWSDVGTPQRLQALEDVNA